MAPAAQQLSGFVDLIVEAVLRDLDTECGKSIERRLDRCPDELAHTGGNAPLVHVTRLQSAAGKPAL